MIYFLQKKFLINKKNIKNLKPLKKKKNKLIFILNELIQNIKKVFVVLNLCNKFNFIKYSLILILMN